MWTALIIIGLLFLWVISIANRMNHSEEKAGEASNLLKAVQNNSNDVKLLVAQLLLRGEQEIEDTEHIDVSDREPIGFKQGNTLKV